MLAAKIYDDKYYNNQYYAIIGGIKVKELNLLEKVFLQSLEYKLFVSQQLYEQYKKRLGWVFWVKFSLECFAGFTINIIWTISSLFRYNQTLQEIF